MITLKSKSIITIFLNILYVRCINAYNTSISSKELDYVYEEGYQYNSDISYNDNIMRIVEFEKTRAIKLYNNFKIDSEKYDVPRLANILSYKASTFQTQIMNKYKNAHKNILLTIKNTRFEEFCSDFETNAEYFDNLTKVVNALYAELFKTIEDIKSCASLLIYYELKIIDIDSVFKCMAIHASKKYHFLNKLTENPYLTFTSIKEICTLPDNNIYGFENCNNALDCIIRHQYIYDVNAHMEKLRSGIESYKNCVVNTRYIGLKQLYDYVENKSEYFNI